MTLRPASAARQSADVPTTHAGDHTNAEVTSDLPGGHLSNPPPGAHPASGPGDAGRNRRRHNRRAAASAPRRPDPAARECPDNTPDAGSLTPVQQIMHARLDAMAQPRDGDTIRLARLRAVLRDQRIMSRVVANVDAWPELTEQQWAEAIALLRPRRDF